MPAALLALLLAAPRGADPGLTELKPYEPVHTAAGKLDRRELPGEEPSLRVMLDDKQLYGRDGSLEFTYLVPQVDAAKDDAVLLAVRSDEPDKKDCTKYLFLLVKPDGTAQPSDEFGNCTEQFKISRAGLAVTMAFADGQAWTYEDGKVAAAAKKSRAKKKK